MVSKLETLGFFGFCAMPRRRPPGCAMHPIRWLHSKSRHRDGELDGFRLMATPEELPLGIAAAAISALVLLAQIKIPFATHSALCEQENVQLDFAWATARLHGAHAFAIEAY